MSEYGMAVMPRIDINAHAPSHYQAGCLSWSLLPFFLL